MSMIGGHCYIKESGGALQISSGWEKLSLALPCIRSGVVIIVGVVVGLLFLLWSSLLWHQGAWRGSSCVILVNSDCASSTGISQLRRFHNKLLGFLLARWLPVTSRE